MFLMFVDHHMRSSLSRAQYTWLSFRLKALNLCFIIFRPTLIKLYKAKIELEQEFCTEMSFVCV